MCGDMIENPRESLPGLQGFTTEISDVINLNPNSMPYGSTATGLMSISDNRAFLPWNLPSNPNQLSNFPVGDDDNFLPWPTSSTSTAAFMGNQRRGLPYGFDRPSFLAGLGIYGAGTDPLVIRGSPSFGLQPDVTKLTAQEIMDAKALAASKNHSEAERRRRERINGHLNRLRTLLPNTTKTDKASLLAEVIQHVKELKRQTSEITETSPVPSEVDELTVDSDEMLSDGRLLIRASICCDDRSDLLSDLIKTLKSLRLRTLKAEITTLGRRVRNVLVVTGEGDHQDQFNDENSGSFGQPSIGCIQEALKAVMERPVSDDSGSSKRQRTNLTMVDHMSTV